MFGARHLSSRVCFGTKKWRNFSTISSYPGDPSKFVNTLQFTGPDKVLPTYRIMDESGTILNPQEDPKVKIIDFFGIFSFTPVG